MTETTRRNILRTAAITAAGVGVAPALDATPSAAADTTSGCPPPLGPVTVTPADPRFDSLLARGNKRGAGRPDYFRIVGGTAQVVAAVREAVRSNRRVAVRSGGHCFEDFVSHPDIRVVIDMSGMTGVYFDAERNAFAVEPGATLAELYRRLYLGWGVTLPAGWGPTVGVGGHVAGGGYGPLCRQLGLVVDYLYAVEVVTVTRSGAVDVVIATREQSDPNRELWWAHTGGGGGNFGVVTRYWFRSPGVTGTDPGQLLPQPPPHVVNFQVKWSWAELDRTRFTRLLRNFGIFAENNSSPDSPFTRLYTEFILSRQPAGAIQILGQLQPEPGGDAEAEVLLQRFLAAVNEGVGVQHELARNPMTWLVSTQLGPDEPDGKAYCLKTKSSYRRTGYREREIAVIHRYLTMPEYDNPNATMSLNSFGGRVGTVAPAATAYPHRDALLKMFFLTAWQDSADEERHLTWMREFYRDLHAATGGVPVPGKDNDGAFVNYPDNDLADPAWNTSGVPWSNLYYKGNYPRLQRAKARWDPRNVFRHALSVQSGH